MARRIEVEPSLRRSSWEATAAGFAAVFAGSYASAGLRIPTSQLLTIAGVAGLLMTVAVLMNTGSRRLAKYTLAWGCLVFGWVAYSRAAPADCWTAWPIAGLVAACLLLGPFGAFALQAWRDEIRERAQSELDRLDAADRRKYAQALSAARCPVKVTSVDHDAGSVMVSIDLPADGSVTIKHLEGAVHTIEVILDVPEGTIRFEHVGTSRKVLMRIGESDVLSEPCPVPDEWGALTVNEPIRLGRREDNGKPFRVLFREVCALIVGQRGSGKSNLANVWISQLSRCVDVLIFVVDLKQGRMARAWVGPWAREENDKQGRLVERPAVDWVATTRDEAYEMLSAVQRAGDARSASGIGGAKHTPTREHPAIAIITDETAVIFGPGGPKAPSVPPPCINYTPHRAHEVERPDPNPGAGGAGRKVTVKCPGVVPTNAQLAELGTDIVQRFRSECMDAIMFALRAVVELTGGGNLKAQTGLRIGLTVEDEAEAMYLLDRDRRASRWLANMGHAGAAVCRYFKNPPVVLKVDQLEDHEEIGKIAAQTWRFRPEPDETIRAAMGKAWDERWSDARAGAFLDSLRAGTPATSAPAGGGTVIDTDLADAWQRTMARPELADLAAVKADVTERQVRVRAIVIAHKDPLGISPNWIMKLLAEDEQRGNGKSPARTTVMDWLKADTQAGIITKRGFGRYGPPQ